MTSEEIATMSRAVAQHFGLWTPRQMCNYGDVRCRHLDEPLADTWEELTQGKFKPHEIPCPDLTQPEWFVRLLKQLQSRFTVKFYRNGVTLDPHYVGHIYTAIGEAEPGLLDAAYQLVQREAAK